MGRKHKITKEQKIKAVLDYSNGISSKMIIANNLNVNVSSIDTWCKQYKELGESAFDYKPHNSKYTKEFKLKVINEYLSGNGSTRHLALKYDIPSNTIVNKWVSLYNNGNEIKDYDPNHEVYTMKARKTTMEERVEIVNHCISNDKNYKITADKYNLPYSLIYQWVKRYEENGDEGLNYSKKGPNKKVNTPTTDIEKLEAENARLKAELKRKELELEIIKKKQYFEELIYSQKSKK